MGHCPTCGVAVDINQSPAAAKAEAALRSLPPCSVAGCEARIVDASEATPWDKLVELAIGDQIWRELSYDEQRTLRDKYLFTLSTTKANGPYGHSNSAAFSTECPNGCRVCRRHDTEQRWPVTSEYIGGYRVRHHRYTCPSCRQEWVVAEIYDSSDSTILATGDVTWQYRDVEDQERYHDGWSHLIVLQPNGKEYHVVNRRASAWHVIPERLAHQSFGRKLHTLRRHSEFVGQTAFSLDGASLASASSDGLIVVWDVKTGRPTLELSAMEQDWPTGLAFSPDAKLILATWLDRLVIWRLSDQKKLTEAKSWSNRRWHTVAADSSFSTLVCAQDRDVAEVELRTGRTRRKRKGHGDEVVAVRLSTDGTKIASSDLTGHVIVWDFRSEAKLLDLRAHSDMVFDVAFDPTGSLLATASFDNTVKIWSMRDGTLLAHLHGNFMPVLEVEFSADGAYLASASDDGSVNLWSLRQQPAAASGIINYAPMQPPYPTSSFMPLYVAGRQKQFTYKSAMSFDHSGRRLAYAAENGTVNVWQLES